MRKAFLPPSLILLFLFLSCGKEPARYISRQVEKEPVSSKSAMVRVLILDTDGKVDIDAGAANAACRQDDNTISDGFLLDGPVTVSRAGRELKVLKRGRGLPRTPILIIRPEGGKGFSINGKVYRGILMLQCGERDNILAINIIDLDDYIKGVLPSEIGYLKKDQYEAFKVQAIASRSYALSKLEEKKGEPYDLRATIMDQVYKGIGGEYPDASRAVDETRGLVALWNGNPIKAYYSSCCGGYTADIRVGWPWKAQFPYLYGNRDAASPGGKSFCSDSRHFRWEEHWTGRDLLKILKKTLPAELGSRVASFNSLVDISTSGVSRSGRIERLRITTENGSYDVTGDRIRWVLRPGLANGPILRSTLFKMEVRRAGGKVVSVDLKGGGNGHGTGMCQTGAIRMAELGHSAEEILYHYYPGITIKRFYQ
ncbi:MAG: SpoIID/LytB domain-containing protein [Candidatus Krumholzibacteriota bacterium]|nr:SpoIID/LytB domain-containing protein [Candidatus Krumholzibacteriota bacterium]